MESTKWKKIYSISLGVAAIGVFAAAVALAVSAGREPAKKKTRTRLPSRRRHNVAARRVHRRPTARKSAIGRHFAPPTALQNMKKQPSDLMTHPVLPKLRPGAPRMKTKIGLTGAAAPIRRPGPATGPGYAPPGYAPGSATGLSPQERKQRRMERQKRQATNLRRRIQSLQERIDTAKNGGSRSEQQINRMTKSLERMQSRLSKIETAIDADEKR